MSIHEDLQGHPWVVQIEIFDMLGENPRWVSMKHSCGDVYTYATEELALEAGRKWYPATNMRACHVDSLKEGTPE